MNNLLVDKEDINGISNLNTHTVSLSSLEEDNKLYYYISKLPDEIKRYIYKEYFESDIYYELYLQILNHELSKKLNKIILRPFVPIILSKKNVLKYICKKCYIFRNYYEQHKIYNKKVFRLMTKGDSITTCILFTFYH